MSIKNFLLSWLVIFSTIVSLDFIWFSLTGPSFYQFYLKDIISGNFNYYVAFIFYFIYSFGILYLIIMDEYSHKINFQKIILKGFTLGFVSYSAYDLTNQATIDNWPIIVTIVDILWGASVTSITSFFSMKIILLIVRK